MIILGEKYNKGILTWIPFFMQIKNRGLNHGRKSQYIYLSTLIIQHNGLCYIMMN